MFNRRALLAGTAGLVGSSPALAGYLALTYAPRVLIYVDSVGGNDSNSGLTPTLAWKTISKVNAGVYVAGTTILFKGSQTITGAISFGTANYSGVHPPTPYNRVTLDSYGTGRATISSTTSTGFAALNIGCFTVQNLIFVGASATTTTVDGVSATNSQSGNTKLQSISFVNLDVSLYGFNGIVVRGTAGTSGFNNVLISGCVAYNCTGGVTPGAGSAGIYVTSNTGYGSGATTPSFTNVTITGCIAHDNTGKAGDTNWTGSGIIAGEATNILIQNCVAYNNGQSGTAASGPVGIWLADAGYSVIQLCESYGNFSQSHADGDGFDLDGGCINCTIQYCYSHGNQGAGFQIYSYNDGQVTSNIGSTVRYCVSQNDGAATALNAGAGNMMIGNDGATVTGVKVYGNTFYQSVSTQPVIRFSGANYASITGHVSNNIFYCTSGLKFINNDGDTGNPSGLEFKGNDYYTTGTFSLTWNATTYTSFASWQTATGQEKISGVNVGLTSDPQLTSPGSGGTIGLPFTPSSLTAYQLQHGSPMIGTGLDMNAQFSIDPGIRDFYGDVIPNGGAGTGYNVGADGANR